MFLNAIWWDGDCIVVDVNKVSQPQKDAKWKLGLEERPFFVQFFLGISEPIFVLL